jgi:SNF2 family DNA or RNA helicase
MSRRDAHTKDLRRDLEILGRLAAAVPLSHKTQALIALLRANPDKTLVFTRFRDTLGAVSAALQNEGIGHAVLHGGLDSAGRSAAIERFRSDAAVLVATQIGSEGQNLQFCHQLVNYDLPWNPMVIEQRIGRLHRMGQTDEVRVFNLCARGTVEERVLDVLDRRVHLFELVVGETDMVLGNLTDERDLEERILDLYVRSRSEAEIDAGFETIAQEILAARGRYEKAKALDEAMFGKEFST